jgi:16S rRNA (cytidine1402-2'-O)-methyltransferase
MLYLVATPIGNLGDFSYRAVETLKLCDYILCEDTRHSRSLLSHYGIDKPLKSYHKFNEATREVNILEDLENGLSIGLITDAGTPGISDPGERLVQAAIDKGIVVTSIPGACAAITAISLSGIPSGRFQFIGFLPKQPGEINSLLQEISFYPGTTIAYESPHRLVKTLGKLNDMLPKRRIAVARELTKKFEEIQRGTAAELLQHYTMHPPKGEIVLLLSGSCKEESPDWSNLTPEEHVAWVENSYLVTRKEAIKMVAKERQTNKRDLYNLLVKPKDTDQTTS